MPGEAWLRALQGLAEPSRAQQALAELHGAAQGSAKLRSSPRACVAGALAGPSKSPYANLIRDLCIHASPTASSSGSSWISTVA
eukprot:7393300-Pyramimonas_sp.AAC.1